MVTLHLLRHGKAKSAPEFADIELPLAERGRSESDRMGRLLAVCDAQPDLILCSSAQRARETLAGVLPHLGGTYRVKVEEQLYTFDTAPIYDQLRQVPQAESSVLLVGHNPALENLTAELSADGTPSALRQLAIEFPTCALATIEFNFEDWAVLVPQTGRLIRLAIPDALDQWYCNEARDR